MLRTQRSRLFLILVIMVCALLIGRDGLMAQEPEPAGPATEQAAAQEVQASKDSLLKIVIAHSGAPGWAIIIMSVFAFYLIVFFSFRLRRSRLLPALLVTGVGQDLDARRLKEAAEKCSGDDSVLARVLRGGMANIRGGYEGMEDVMEEVAEAESIRLHQQVSWLSIIGTIAPMLGLTGTVMGMIQAFEAIKGSGSAGVPIDEMAQYIEFALVTTAEGLIVAVPVLLAYAVFRNRATTLMLEVGVAASELLDRLRGIEVTPEMLSQLSGSADSGVPSASGEAQGPDEGPPPLPPKA